MTSSDFTKPIPADNFFGGSFDVADTATTSTPITIPGTSTFIKLTNNGLGTQTNNSFAPIGITELWDTTNDDFDLTVQCSFSCCVVWQWSILS